MEILHISTKTLQSPGTNLLLCLGIIQQKFSDCLNNIYSKA